MTDFVATVMMVSGGYPGTYEKGKLFKGSILHGSVIFHSGTKKEGDKVVTSGGRVFAVSSWGSSMKGLLNIFTGMPGCWILKVNITGRISDLIFKTNATAYIQRNRTRSNIFNNYYSHYCMGKCNS